MAIKTDQVILRLFTRGIYEGINRKISRMNATILAIFSYQYPIFIHYYAVFRKLVP